MKKEKIDARLVRGVELFNAQEYFESHDVIEDLWLETKPSDAHRDFYKALIQSAASVYQWQRGILSGARGLHSSSLQYLEKYSPWALGIDVASLIQEMKLGADALQSGQGVWQPKIKYHFNEFQIIKHSGHLKKHGHSR